MAHERLGLREGPVVIHPGGEVTVNLAWAINGATTPDRRPLFETQRGSAR